MMETQGNLGQNNAGNNSGGFVKRERERSTDCYVCNESFATADEMNAHMQKHTNIAQFVCEICDQTFPTKEYLLLHKKYHAGEVVLEQENHDSNPRKKRKKFKCTKCDVKVNSQYHLDIHQSKHGVKQKNTKKVYPSIRQKQVLKHLLMSDSQLRSAKTTPEFTKKMAEERWKIIGNKLNSYQGARKTWQEWRKTWQDMKAANKKKYGQKLDIDIPVADDTSQTTDLAEFDVPKFYETHKNDPLINTVKEEAGMQMSSNKRFNQSSSSDDSSDEGEDAKKHICEICSKSFIALQFLKTHLLTHSAVATYNCMICGATFTGQAYLKLHMQMHTQAKKFKCMKCDEWFGTKQCLKAHMKKHTKMKNFNCEVCDKSFVSRITMEKHRQGHEENPGEGMVRCDQCGRAVRASLLRTHKERSHKDMETRSAGEVKRPFKCNVCGRHFIVELNLKLHVRLVHPEYAEDMDNNRCTSPSSDED